MDTPSRPTPPAVGFFRPSRIRDQPGGIVAVLVLMATGISALSQAPEAAAFRPALLNLDSGLVVGDSFRAAQTFTAMETGTLGSLSLLLSRNGLIVPDLVPFELRRTDATGAPGEVIVRLSLAGFRLTDRTSPVFQEVDFTGAGIPIEAGVSYALMPILDPSVGIHAGGVAWHGTITGPGVIPGGEAIPDSLGYADGKLWESFDAGMTWNAKEKADLGFEVRLVPEPGTGSLLLLGAILIASRNGHRRPPAAQRVGE